MGERPSGDFGRRLKEARERRGVSLRQISTTTKIGVSALEALERNDFSKLPGGIFSRAFVRSYAIEVGLDPDEIAQEFIDQVPKSSFARHGALLQAEDHEAVESDRRIATTFVRQAVISLPLAVAIMYFGSTGRSPSIPAAAPPTAADAVLSRAEAPAPAAAARVEQAAAAPSIEQLTVSLAAVRECWVGATVDGVRAVERLMRPGEVATLEVRRELALTMGDAAALSVTINGAPVRPLGEPGQVVTVRLGLANFKEYLANP
jgi:cytoskeletal protein RodZ